MIFARDTLDLNSMIGVTLLTCLLYLSVICLQFHVHVPPKIARLSVYPFAQVYGVPVTIHWSGFPTNSNNYYEYAIESLHYAFIIVIVEFQVVVVVLEEGVEEEVGLVVPVLQRQVPSRTTKETK